MEREPGGLDRSAGLWAIFARTRSDKLHFEGGEKPAVTFVTLTVHCSMDMMDVIEK